MAAESPVLRAQQYVWTNFAGQPGGAGNADGPVGTARFDEPYCIALDSGGNLYVGQNVGNEPIRKISRHGAVTTVTDNTGAPVELHTNGLAVGADGSLYGVDQSGSAIYKISSSGEVAVWAGTLYETGSNDGTGMEARFNRPWGLAADAEGNFYLADTDNHVIRKISSAGVVTTLAGSPEVRGSTDGTGSAARFNAPSDLTVDREGNVYVMDEGNFLIRKINPAGMVTTFAGTLGQPGNWDGPAHDARFGGRAGMAVDREGNLYLAEEAYQTVRKISSDGMVSTLAGKLNSYGSSDGKGSLARFRGPAGVVVDEEGTLYVTDLGNHAVRKITADGMVTTLAGSWPQTGSADGAGSGARFFSPNGVAVDAAGNAYVADTENQIIRKITSAGIVTTLAGSPEEAGSLDGTGSAARFFFPGAVAVDGAGNVYVADSGNNTIRKITSAGVVSTLAGLAGSYGSSDGTGSQARFAYPIGVAVDGAGNIYVAENNPCTIRKITSAGVVTTVAGKAGVSSHVDGPVAGARFENPCGVAVDGGGNLLVADGTTIRKISSAGVVSTLAGSPDQRGATDGTGGAARFSAAVALAVDGGGNVYVADRSGSAIRKVSAAGVVNTIGGTADVIGGADGFGSAALFADPAGIAVGPDGTVLVADPENNRISKGVPGFPVASLLAADDTGVTTIRLRGLVNPNGNVTTAQFEYGPTTAYGSTASVVLSPADGTSVQPVDTVISGLSLGATCHYRLIATNAVGTSATGDASTSVSGNLTFAYDSASDVPLTGVSFAAGGSSFSATLNFAPPTGTSLMVINSTGLEFISGAFSNLAHGQTVRLSYGGATYRFVANYFGGTGNDLVLQWADTKAYAWGEGGSGELGNNTDYNGHVPDAVDASGVLSGKTILSVAAGAGCSLALCSDGTLAAWGQNGHGRLGNDGTTNTPVPVAVDVSPGSALHGKTVVSMACGMYHTIALCSDGTVACWGLNQYGRLGTGDTFESHVPVAVNTSGVLAGRTVVAVAAGEAFNLALCSDGMVAAWGYNSSGQLGNGTLANSLVPVAVNASGVLAGKLVTSVAAGATFGVALCSDGTLAAWGSARELGNGSGTDSSVPVLVDKSGVLSGRTPLEVAAGGYTGLVRCADGTLAIWGRVNFSSVELPVAVDTSGVLAGRTVVALSVGIASNFALCSDGTLTAWGDNWRGALGNGGSEDSDVPVVVSTRNLPSGARFAAGKSGVMAGHALGVVSLPLPPAPLASTLDASSLAAESATLNGLVDAMGSSDGAQASFDYGLNATYDHHVEASPAAVMDGSNGAVSVIVTGLAPGTTYHYRVSAASVGGTSHGSDRTFTTLSLQAGWRQQYFGITGNEGDAADDNDYDGDGLSNLLEWACHLDPVQPSVLWSNTSLAENGSSLEIIYTRSIAALNAGAIFEVEWNDTLAGPGWGTAGVTEQILADNGTVQRIKAFIPAASQGTRFARLKVTGPP